MTDWREYVEQVRSWRHVKAEDRDHALFVGNALDTGQSSFQAAVGWALVSRNAANAQLPRKLRRGPGKPRHRGRVTTPTVGAVSNQPGAPHRTSRMYATGTRRLRRGGHPITHAEVRRAQQRAAVAAARQRRKAA